MFAVGLNSSEKDFIEAFNIPKAIISGYVGQFVIKPFLGYLFDTMAMTLFGLPTPLGNINLSKLQKSSFTYVPYCKLHPLSSIIRESVLDVCKLLQVMSFNPNLVIFLWLNLTKWARHEGIFIILLSCGVHLVRLNHKNTLMWGPFAQTFN
ncbi:putative Bile acid:sodium symporter/arsenical resistance protein Acr3 [Helianthus anomalus]